jgi:hypothetical protein
MPRDASKTVVYKGYISKLDEKQIQILRMDPLSVHPILSTHYYYRILKYRDNYA